MDVQIDVHGLANPAIRAAPQTPQCKHVVIIRAPARASLLTRQSQADEQGLLKLVVKALVASSTMSQRRSSMASQEPTDDRTSAVLLHPLLASDNIKRNGC